jgi:hypothetical protein
MQFDVRESTAQRRHLIRLCLEAGLEFMASLCQMTGPSFRAKEACMTPRPGRPLSLSGVFERCHLRHLSCVRVVAQMHASRPGQTRDWPSRVSFRASRKVRGAMRSRPSPRQLPVHEYLLLSIVFTSPLLVYIMASNAQSSHTLDLM